LDDNGYLVIYPKGADAITACSNLIEITKANVLEPYNYLLHILQNITKADTVEKLETLLPCVL
jgi:hypothetical protein